MTHTVASLTEIVLDLIRGDGADAVMVWQEASDAARSKLTRAIRNTYGLHEPDRIPADVTVEEFSIQVYDAVYAQVKDWDANAFDERHESTVTHYDELDEEEFEQAGGDLAALEGSYPTLSVDTAEAMKRFMWIHHTGAEYTIVEIANLEADVARRVEYPVIVVYRSIETGQVWAKTLGEFHMKFSRGDEL